MIQLEDPLTLGIIVEGWYSIKHKGDQGAAVRVEFKQDKANSKIGTALTVPFILKGKTKETFTPADVEGLQIKAIAKVKKMLEEGFHKQCESRECKKNK